MNSCYLLPIPREIIESFAANLGSSMRQACETKQQQITHLEAELARTKHERDKYRAERDTMNEQLQRVMAALGMNRG